MGFAIRTGAILFALCNLARADLDLTPHAEAYDMDGIKMRQLVFADGARRVTYSPPKKWEYSGGGSRFVLHPNTESDAEAAISVAKLSHPQSFNEEAVKALSDEIRGSLPDGASNVAVVSEQLNPLLIDRKETFMVVLSYDYYGRPYQRSVMFLNRKDEQVRFQLTCSRPAFPELQKAFQASHYSWQNL